MSRCGRKSIPVTKRSEGTQGWEWKQVSGYHQRSKAETVMYRFKQLISSKLSLRNYSAQVGESLAEVKAINKMTGLGMPVRLQVN